MLRFSRIHIRRVMANLLRHLMPHQQDFGDEIHRNGASAPPEMTVITYCAKIFSALLLLGLLTISTARAQADAPIAFVVLGPNGPVARVITSDAQCPIITVDGTSSVMQTRAAPNADFPVTVCDTQIPANAKTASVLERELKLLANGVRTKPQRVVVLGDSGCRLKGDRMQACNDPAQWPFAAIAKSAMATNPDLVIHVGDYHYRESPCVVDKADCAGSPYGDNWASWNADLFTPARALLQAAPWVVVRGNHEDCTRAGTGYFRLIDPRPLPASCPQYSDPYTIDYMDPQLLMLDNSAVNDFEVQADQLAAYKPQIETLNAAAKGTAWWLQHDPMYVFGHLGEKDGKEQLFIDQLTLQQASNNTFPKSVQAFISGHVHLFEVLSFGEGRPPQLVVGNGGTLLDTAITTPLTGLEMAGMKVGFGEMIDHFGFVTMERATNSAAGDKWALAIRNVNGGEMDKCVLGDGSLLCGQVAVPKVGEDFSSQGQLWVALALFGAAIVFSGLALRLRGHNR